MAFGEGLEHGDPLGADREAVGGVLDVAAGEDRAVGRFERRTDLEFGERGVGILAGASRCSDQIDVARPIAEPPRAEAAIAADTAVACDTADVLAAPFEAGPAVRFERRALAVDQQPLRVWTAYAVHHVRDARDLKQLGGERLHFRVRMTRLSRRRVGPVTHGVKAQRLRLVTNGLGAAVALPGDHRLELTREREKGGVLPLEDVDRRHRQAAAIRVGQ